MRKTNENGQIIGGAAEMLNEVFNDADNAMNSRLGSVSPIKGYKVLIYGSELTKHMWGEISPYSIKVYAVYSTRKNASGKYNFKDFLFEITNDEDAVLFESCSLTEALNYVGPKLVELEQKAEDDAEWEKLMDETNALNDEANELTADVEENMTSIDGYIDTAKTSIDDAVKYGELSEYDIETISLNIKNIKKCLDCIKESADCFIARACRITDCSFGFGDWFSELVYDFDSAPIGFELDEDFTPEDIFNEIMDYLFENATDEYEEKPDVSENLLNLRDTLFNYLAA